MTINDKMDNKKIRVLYEKDKIYKTIKLNVDDVENLYGFDVDVQFVPYEGTIIHKTVKSIRNKKTNKNIGKLEFGEEVLLSLGYTAPKEIKTFFKTYAYWNDNGDCEWHNTLSKGVSEITLMFTEDIES